MIDECVTGGFLGGAVREMVEIELNVPEEVWVCGYERIEARMRSRWTGRNLTKSSAGSTRRTQRACIEWSNRMQDVHDQDVRGQGGFVYRHPYHRCGWLMVHPWLPPPFKLKHDTATDRFEERVLRELIAPTQQSVENPAGLAVAVDCRRVMAYGLCEEGGDGAGVEEGKCVRGSCGSRPVNWPGRRVMRSSGGLMM